MRESHPCTSCRSRGATMDDIRERDLSNKPYDDYTDEEKRELARRFREFTRLVKEKGPDSLGLRSKPKRKRVRKWQPGSAGAVARRVS